MARVKTAPLRRLIKDSKWTGGPELSGDKIYSPEEVEFLKAIDSFRTKTLYGKPATLKDVFYIAKGLGWSKEEETPMGHMVKASLLEDLGDLRAARKQIKKALYLDPDNEETKLAYLRITALIEKKGKNREVPKSTSG